MSWNRDWDNSSTHRGLGNSPADRPHTADPPKEEIEEIERRKQSIQAGWSDDVAESKVVGGGYVPWTIPMFVTVYVPGQPFKRLKDKRTKIYKPV